MARSAWDRATNRKGEFQKEGENARTRRILFGCPPTVRPICPIARVPSWKSGIQSKLTRNEWEIISLVILLIDCAKLKREVWRVCREGTKQTGWNCVETDTLLFHGSAVNHASNFTGLLHPGLNNRTGNLHRWNITIQTAIAAFSSRHHPPTSTPPPPILHPPISPLPLFLLQFDPLSLRNRIHSKNRSDFEFWAIMVRKFEEKPPGRDTVFQRRCDKKIRHIGNNLSTEF